jgi:hypothetical protein
MHVDNLNRWPTLGANIGVVVGLALLVVELNQNSELVRAQIHQAQSDNYVSDVMALADSEFLLPAYEKLSHLESAQRHFAAEVHIQRMAQVIA